MKFEHILPALEVDLLSFPTDLADENGEMPHSDATIRFNVSIEPRNYGVKGIYAYTDSIDLMLTNDTEFIVYPDQPCRLKGNADDTWEIIDDLDLSGGSIVPDRVELDWKTKKAYVYYS